MPIKFKCSKCGHVLSVPREAAGKQGKCPQCAQPLRVPVPTAKAGTASPPTRPPAARPAAGSIPPQRLDSLLDEVGLVRKSGPICPSCGVDLKPGANVCVACGFNLQTQQKIAGFNAQSQRPEFDNLYLQQAVDNMQRDTLMESRREKSALPWWAVVSFLLGVLLLCGAGVLLVDVHLANKSDDSTGFHAPNSAPADSLLPEHTRMGRIQRLPVFVILGSTAALTGMILALFAHLSICSYAFQQQLRLGFACFFLPLLFSLPYGIMNWTNNKAPIKGLMLAAVFMGLGAGLIQYGGGFGTLQGVW